VGFHRRFQVTAQANRRPSPGDGGSAGAQTENQPTNEMKDRTFARVRVVQPAVVHWICPNCSTKNDSCLRLQYEMSRCVECKHKIILVFPKANNKEVRRAALHAICAGIARM
jgi:DNA-directed RNA polymerase subunit RPC12/RpoP